VWILGEIWGFIRNQLIVFLKFKFSTIRIWRKNYPSYTYPFSLWSSVHARQKRKRSSQPRIISSWWTMKTLRKLLGPTRMFWCISMFRFVLIRHSWLVPSRRCIISTIRRRVRSGLRRWMDILIRNIQNSWVFEGTQKSSSSTTKPWRTTSHTKVKWLYTTSEASSISTSSIKSVHSRATISTTTTD